MVVIAHISATNLFSNLFREFSRIVFPPANLEPLFSIAGIAPPLHYNMLSATTSVILFFNGMIV